MILRLGFITLLICGCAVEDQKHTLVFVKKPVHVLLEPEEEYRKQIEKEAIDRVLRHLPKHCDIVPRAPYLPGHELNEAIRVGNGRLQSIRRCNAALKKAHAERIK